MKTVIQHQAIGVGLRSRYCIIINIQSKDRVTTLSKYYGSSLRVEEDFKEFSKASRHIFSADLVTCLPEIVSIWAFITKSSLKRHTTTSLPTKKQLLEPLQVH